MCPTDPAYDPAIEAPLGMKCFAAISLGDHDEWLISFSLTEPIEEQHVHYMLTTVYYIANLKIREKRLEAYIAEARKIQMSLLPTEFPQFYDYDIYGKSFPAAIVGGDIFDIIPISDTILGLVDCRCQWSWIAGCTSSSRCLYRIADGARKRFEDCPNCAKTKFGSVSCRQES